MDISGATSDSCILRGLTNFAKRSNGVPMFIAVARHNNKTTTKRCFDLRTAMLKASVELINIFS